MQGNASHVVSRYLERCERRQGRRFSRALEGLRRRFKANSMPNGAWYRPVNEGKELYGYIVGQGNWVSSILAADMTPKGQRV
jgi:hypothetical protein